MDRCRLGLAKKKVLTMQNMNAAGLM